MQVITAAILTLALAIDAALVDSGIWDKTSCTGNPYMISRSDINVDCKQYSGVGCTRTAPGPDAPMTYSAKYACPSAMQDPLTLIPSAARYASIEVFGPNTNCVGTPSTRQLLLADRACRRFGSGYMKAVCTATSVTVYSCTDIKCTTGCTVAYGGALNFCQGTMYKYSCPLVGGATPALTVQ